MHDLDTYTDIINCVLYTMGRRCLPAKPLLVTKDQLLTWEAEIISTDSIADTEKADAIRLLHSYIQLRRHPSLFSKDKPSLFLSLPTRELYTANSSKELARKVGKPKLYKLLCKHGDKKYHVGYKTHGGWQYFCIDYININN
jgi:hypothetical protein